MKSYCILILMLLLPFMAFTQTVGTLGPDDSGNGQLIIGNGADTTALLKHHDEGGIHLTLFSDLKKRGVDLGVSEDGAGLLGIYNQDEKVSSILFSSPNGEGAFLLFNQEEKIRVALGGVNDYGQFSLFNNLNERAVRLRAEPLNEGKGSLELFGLNRTEDIDSAKVKLFVDSGDAGFISMRGSENTLHTTISENEHFGGEIDLYGEDFLHTQITMNENNGGEISLFDTEGSPTRRVHLFATAYNTGELNLFGDNGTRIVGIGTPDISNPDLGWMGTYDANDNLRTVMQSSATDAGQQITFGSNNSFNTFIGNDLISGGFGRPSSAEHGYVGIFNHENDEKAGMFVRDYRPAFNATNGYVFADVVQSSLGHAYMYDDFVKGYVEADIITASETKNFRIPHPEKADKEIWYACIEGPEAAVYTRGTTRLENGKAFIELPDHFKLVAEKEGMTVIVTPLSADSKGLAVTKKDLKGVIIQELYGGNGNYEFDWEIKTIRKGYKDYQVVRNKRERPAINMKTRKLSPEFVASQRKADPTQQSTEATSTTHSANKTSATENLKNPKATLKQNKPNPFNQSTQIDYDISEGVQSAILEIVDMQGKMVKRVQLSTKGQGSVGINANELKSGTYVYSLIVDGSSISSKKMVLTK